MCIWRALKMQKRSGQDYGIDEHFPLRVQGSFMVPCFACPEPGFNMDNEEMDDEEIQ